MSDQIIAHFDVTYRQYMNERAEVMQPLPAFASDAEHLEKLYRMMVLTRTFDKKAISLQRTGQLGTYPSTLGQEAISVAVGAAMRPEDVLCPYYREYGAQFWRGVGMHEILLYWGGDERGSCFENRSASEDFPITVPIASQTLHAVGVATAFDYRSEKRVAVAAIGDGGTSRGDFYEAMNVAGAWHLPVVFVVNNNQWAISVARSAQTKAETLAQKAIAAGIQGIQTDGNDVIGMQAVVSEAIERARDGGGATVVEAMSYRMCDHTTADDASRYRPESELNDHKKKCPIVRLRTYMAQQNMWNEDKEKQLYESVSEEISVAVDRYLSMERQPCVSMLEHMYETVPDAYLAQHTVLSDKERSR